MTTTIADPAADLADTLLGRIASEAREGLPNEQVRLDACARQVKFYRGQFEEYSTREPGMTYGQYRYERPSLIMQRVVHVLSANLYRKGPRRSIPDLADATAWVEAVYKRLAMDALWHEADRLAIAGDVALLQVAGAADPDCPVKVHLWDSGQFTVWTDPDDPRVPVAVAVLDAYDARRRIRVWTARQVLTFLSKKLAPGQTAGGTAYELAARELNPYGVLPFVPVHFHFPATDFWSGGPGANLEAVNDYANWFLTDHGDAMRYCMRPVITALNVRAGWRPPAPIKPGDLWDVPAAGLSGDGAEPKVNYLQPDTGFVQAGWDDLQAYLDHAMEMVGVPPGTVRMVQDSGRSGVSIIAEQAPLILWAEGRQSLFGHFEQGFLRVLLTVAAAHLKNNEAGDPARGLGPRPELAASRAMLEAAAADADALVLHWPDMYPDMPGPDRDSADGWELEAGLTSRTKLLMRRRRLTREEAIAELEEVAADRAREQALLGPILLPGAAPAGAGAGEPGAEPDHVSDTDTDPGPDTGGVDPLDEGEGDE